MNDKLIEIIKIKQRDIQSDKRTTPLGAVRDRANKISGKSRFAKNITAAKDIALIAEIKLATPAGDKLGDSKDVAERATEYERAGAEAISYITEHHYFKGDSAAIAEIKKNTHLPVLQKDFVIDEYQVYQARIAGADALLLIARLVDRLMLRRLTDLTLSLGIEPVVEVHNSEDLEKAVATKSRFIAVNARDLKNLKIDVAAACKLIRKIPDKFVKLGFSGVSSSVQVKKYKDAGARAVLVGTELMKTNDIRGFIREIRS